MYESTKTKSFSDRNQKRSLQHNYVDIVFSNPISFSDRNQKRSLQLGMSIPFGDGYDDVSVIEIRSDRFNVISTDVLAGVKSFSDRNQKRPLQHKCSQNLNRDKLFRGYFMGATGSDSAKLIIFLYSGN